MTSAQTTATTAARSGTAPNAVVNANRTFQESFLATDTITMGATEANGNRVTLFGGVGFNMSGCRLVPEAIRVRPSSVPSGTVSYVCKIVRTLAGTSTDVTADMTLTHNGIITATAASVSPQTALAVDEILELVITSATMTHVAGKVFEIEVPLHRRQAPGQ